MSASSSTTTFAVFRFANPSGLQEAQFGTTVSLNVLKDVLKYHSNNVEGDIFVNDIIALDLEIPLRECHGKVEYKANTGETLAWRVENIPPPPTAAFALNAFSSASAFPPTSTTAAFAELPPCPCDLYREEVLEGRLLGATGRCTAEYANGSEKICGRPLGAHLRRPVLQAPPAEIPSKSSFEMTCEIRVIYGDAQMVITVIVDSGCQEELTLESMDIENLNLPQIGRRAVLYPDGSTGEAKMYDTVMVEVSLSDGSVVQASVAPVSLTQVEERVGAVVAERILGFPALDKLNLKLDFRAKKLTKRIRRI